MNKIKTKRYNRQLDYSKFESSIIEFANSNKILSQTDYLIITSIKDRLTYILENKSDTWLISYKWSCTVGKPSTPTIKGIFSVGVKYESIGGDDVSVKYATNINGQYYYHSILYDKNGNYVYDDRLGVAISHGCIRLATQNAKWIFENVPNETTIVIH